MAIQSETIINKMMKELQQAQVNQNNHPEMVKRIENVRLLSELLIGKDNVESEIKSPSPKDISGDEMKAMLGSTRSNKTSDTHESEADLEDANGKSILDF